MKDEQQTSFVVVSTGRRGTRSVGVAGQRGRVVNVQLVVVADRSGVDAVRRHVDVMVESAKVLLVSFHGSE